MVDIWWDNVIFVPKFNLTKPQSIKTLRYVQVLSPIADYHDIGLC